MLAFFAQAAVERPTPTKGHSEGALTISLSVLAAVAAVCIVGGVWLVRRRRWQNKTSFTVDRTAENLDLQLGTMLPSGDGSFSPGDDANPTPNNRPSYLLARRPTWMMGRTSSTSSVSSTCDSRRQSIINPMVSALHS